MIMKDISYDWENKRCSPKYIFYSGFLKSITGDPFKDTHTNFVECTNPTKTNSSGNNKFQIVFDTADTITKTSNTIIDYSNDIMSEANRIKTEGENNLSNMKEKTNIISTSVNQLYNYQLKLYNMLKMYFERIFLILDTISKYTTDMKLLHLSNKKYELTNGTEQLTTFINSINKDYNDIYTDNITNAVKNLKDIKAQAGASYSNADYTSVDNSINLAISDYEELIEKLKSFDEKNRRKLNSIDTICKTLTENNIKYTSIFPFLEVKMKNGEYFEENPISLT